MPHKFDHWFRAIMHPQRISEEKLKRAAEATKLREEARTIRLQGEYTEQEIFERDMQEKFLASFEQNFSVPLSKMASGATRAHLIKWKETDYSFAMRWNEILDEHGEVLIGTVMARAVGYMSKDTNGNVVVDPMGNPIVMGGDSKLAIAMLKAIHPDSFGDKKSLNVNHVNPLQIIRATGVVEKEDDMGDSD